MRSGITSRPTEDLRCLLIMDHRLQDLLDTVEDLLLSTLPRIRRTPTITTTHRLLLQGLHPVVTVLQARPRRVMEVLITRRLRTSTVLPPQITLRDLLLRPEVLPGPILIEVAEDLEDTISRALLSVRTRLQKTETPRVFRPRQLLRDVDCQLLYIGNT